MSKVSDRTEVVFACSVGFKEDLGRAAEKAGMSMGAAIRQAVATVYGLDLSKEPDATALRRYASPEDRKAAQKARAAEKAALVRRLLAEHKAKGTR